MSRFEGTARNTKYKPPPGVVPFLQETAPCPGNAAAEFKGPPKPRWLIMSEDPVFPVDHAREEHAGRFTQGPRNSLNHQIVFDFVRVFDQASRHFHQTLRSHALLLLKYLLRGFQLNGTGHENNSEHGSDAA